ncbi:hypothetical protein B0E43_09295 [Algoriphagus sp. A40]|nr:hypothetical protein B0E43_09295 [Algoriphagus sp. A40]
MIRIGLLIILFFSTLSLGRVENNALDHQNRIESERTVDEISQVDGDFIMGGRESSNFTNYSSNQKLVETISFFLVSKFFLFFNAKDLLREYNAPNPLSTFVELVIFNRVLRI